MSDRPESAIVIKRGLGAILMGIVFFMIASFEAQIIRPPIHPRPEIGKDPLQTPTSAKPFVAYRKGIKYYLEPKFDYDISGLVVSYHDSSSWHDISHEAWGDYINTRDLCVVWGDNLKNDLYRKISFSSGDWTCYFSSNDSTLWRLFRPDQVSNNHVLPADDQVAAVLSEATYGDQIQMKGYLVNYEKVGHPPGRISSITRTDTGNGACEVIWVKEARFLHRQPGIWRAGKKLGLLTILGGILAVAFGIGLTWSRGRGD